MLSTEMNQITMDFPMSSTKPGHYSDKEVAKPSAPSKHTDNLCTTQSESQTNLEKLYQITTSLPVSTALLAAITSQGVPVGGSLWYFNYSAILVILLTTVAVAISYLSVTASHSFCETVFLAIYTPTSQLLNVTINIRDVYQDEETRNQQPIKPCAPQWFKQFLFISISMAATKGLTLYSMVYVVCVTLVYSGISSQLKNCFEVAEGLQKSSSSSPARRYLYSLALLSSVLGDIVIRQGLGVMSLAYFILIDSNTVKAIKQAVDTKNIEIMEGLEQYYAEGLIQLLEVALTISAVAAQPCICLLCIPVFYFSIYTPIVEFRINVSKINSESLCLSNFQRASTEELSNYNDVCAVCLCAMKYARITPCKHIFHGKCLKDCLKKKAQCPMCNSQVL